MLAGDFEISVEVYCRLITDSPDQMPFVQQRFLRMRDRNLYEIVFFELEEVLAKLDYTHAAYSQMYQLLIWFLIETEEYNRAYHVALYFVISITLLNFSHLDLVILHGIYIHLYMSV